MINDETASEESVMFGGRWAAGLCAGLILGFGVITVFSYSDASRRGVLEHFVQSRGVGDAALFPVPAVLEPGKPVASFEGRMLYPENLKSTKMRDSRMIRAGLDDTKAFSVYHSTEKGTKPDELFLKVSDERYLKVRLEPKQL